MRSSTTQQIGSAMTSKTTKTTRKCQKLTSVDGPLGLPIVAIQNNAKIMPFSLRSAGDLHGKRSACWGEYHFGYEM